MGSEVRSRLRSRLLKVALVLALCFAAGLTSAGVVSGASPLSVLSAITDTGSTDTGTTDTTTTESTETDPTDSEPTEPEATEPPAEPEPADTTETETSPPAPTTQAVVAEKDDYVPNEIVTLWGSGWAADETVEIFVNDDEGKSWSHTGTATADALGGFMYEFRLPDWFVATYYVTATGASGVTVSSTFDDSVAVGGSSTNSNGGSGMASQEITISAPAVAAGDVLVAHIVITDSITSTVICPPSGWTSIRNNNREDKLRQHTFWFRAPAAAGATSYIWTFRTSSCGGSPISAGTKGASAGVIRYTGVIASGDPVDVSAGSDGSSSGPFNAPAVTPTVANTRIVRFFGVFKNTDITGSNRIYHVSSSTTKERAAAAFDGGMHATPGTTTGTFGVSLGSTAEFASQTVALKPAVAVSDAPAVNSPICAGATSVSGTSSEATGTTIEVFRNGASVGTTTTVAGGTWTKSSLAALVAGDQIKAKATAPGETVSGDSNAVTVASCNAAPAAAANLAQFRSNGTTAVALGGFTNESTVVLKGDLSDPDTNDSVKLEVEVKPVGTAFDGSGTVLGSAVTDPATASATVSSLADGGYHWRARAVDDDGAAGPWTSFGGNPETTAADFTVDTVGPTLTASATSPPAGPAYVAGTWTNQAVRVAGGNPQVFSSAQA